MNTKPCPFCGSEDIEIIDWPVNEDMPSEHLEYALVCQNCEAEGPNDLGKSGALEQWNMRRPEDKLKKLAHSFIHEFDVNFYKIYHLMPSEVTAFYQAFKQQVAEAEKEA